MSSGSSLLSLPHRAVVFGWHQAQRPIIAARTRRFLGAGTTLAAMPDIAPVRQATLAFFERLRVEGSPYGRYRYTLNGTAPLLYASAYAALTRSLYDDLSVLSPSQRSEWVAYLASYQGDDGLFHDPAIACPAADEGNSWGWRHLTLHMFMAFAALGAVAPRLVESIRRFRTRADVNGWLETRDWANDAPEVSNEVQNEVTFLQYARDFQGQAWAGDAVSWMLDWLEQHASPVSGLWGPDPWDAHTRSIAVQTGYHLWLLFAYDQRPVRCPTNVVDACLATQNSLGGFGPRANSTACEDIDSIDPLFRFAPAGYKQDHIWQCAARALPWVLANMNDDGGFAFQRVTPFNYGHPAMLARANESAAFPSWFRTLSLAYLGHLLPASLCGRYHWQFLRCPGHQFA